MFYAFCHNWSIVLCETKSKLFPARTPNYQAIFRKVWICGNVYNWLSHGIVGNSVCRTWESCTLAFPCAVNRVIHDSIASYAHFHNADYYGIPPYTDLYF